MQLTAIKRELSRPRWGTDTVVCSLAASCLYLYIIWLTRMFETSPPDPGRLIMNTIVIVFGYTVSTFVGRMFLKSGLSSLVWVSGIGSVIIAITGAVLALSTTIEHHNRFAPDSSLTRYLITDMVPGYLAITLSLTTVTIIAALAARALRSLFGTRSDWP